MMLGGEFCCWLGVVWNKVEGRFDLQEVIIGGDGEV